MATTVPTSCCDTTSAMAKVPCCTDGGGLCNISTCGSGATTAVPCCIGGGEFFCDTAGGMVATVSC